MAKQHQPSSPSTNPSQQPSERQKAERAAAQQTSLSRAPVAALHAELEAIGRDLQRQGVAYSGSASASQSGQLAQPSTPGHVGSDLVQRYGRERSPTQERARECDKELE